MTTEETPRFSKEDELGFVLDHYLGDDEIVSEKPMESAVWHCPQCGEVSLVAKFEWGKAGCLEENCELPKSMNVIGLIGWFEGLDPKTDKRAIYKRRKEILGRVWREEEQRRREIEELEKAERQDREQEQDRWEAQQLQDEQEDRQLRDLHAQAGEFYTAEELQEIVHRGREQKRKKEEAQKRERIRQWREQTEAGHRAAVKRAIMAETKITAGELLLSLAVLAAMTYGVYWLVGRVESFAEYTPYGELGFPDQEEEGWILRSLRGVADWVTVDAMVAYRLQIGLLLGTVTGLMLWSYSRDRRRQQAAFANDEALQVVRYDIEVRDD